MATKYIVQSGGVRNYPDKKRAWHKEIISGLSNDPKVLVCLFAQPREIWEAKFPEYSKSFQEDMPEGIKPTFRMAVPSTFAEDCKWADIIYCMGGDDALAKYWFEKLNIPSVWDGKVVSVNSASSDALVKHYFTCDWRLCGDGLGILPIKFLPHFKSTYGNNDPRGPVDWDDAKKELEAYGDTSLPVHALEEGDYIVIEQ